jgi:hypothetical protein
VLRFVLAGRVSSRSLTVMATVSVAGEVVGSPAYQTAWGLSALLVARYDIAAINPAVIVKRSQAHHRGDDSRRVRLAARR